jgi:hypothetical protein
MASSPLAPPAPEDEQAVDLSDNTQFINDFINNYQTTTDDSIAGANARDSRTGQGQLTNQAQTRVTQNTMNSTVAQNPIAQAGGDTVNQAVTQVSQQLIVTGASKLNAAVNKAVGIPLIQTATDVTNGFFMLQGLASTASIEVLMQLARSNATLIVQQCAAKTAIIKTLKADAISIYNALVILLNSEPFFDTYYTQLVGAYNDIKTADVQLKNIASILQIKNLYNHPAYQRAITTLQAAEALILPSPNASISEISLGTSLLATIKRKTNIDALAAAMNIPILTARFAENYLTYVSLTVEINLLITLFLSALGDFINTYKQNANINQATINHINSATAQLDSLLNDMSVMLFPTDGRQTKFTYPGQVTTAGTGWGIRLATTIQYLMVEPGYASQSLSQTGESLIRYNAALVKIKAQGNIKQGLATLVVTQSQEDIANTSQIIGKILLAANAVVATQTAPASIRNQFQQLQDLLTCAASLDGIITNALTPFINTPFNLLNGAGAVVSQMVKVANELGMDRAAGLLTKCDIKGFYAMNAQTATYAGAAAAGVAAVIGAAAANPNTTDSQLASLQTVHDDINRQAANQTVEAQRSSSTTASVYTAQQQQQLQQYQSDANSAIAAAQVQDPTVAEDPETQSAQIVAQAQGNQFNFDTQGSEDV